MTVSALIHAQCPPANARPGCQQAGRRGIVWSVLAQSVPGPAGAAALARQIHHFSAYAVKPSKPTELINFGEAVNFPLLFGIMLSLFGAATMVHLLLVSVARRRRETGLLKVLGFVRYQVAAVVCWQATTIAVIGVVAGVPLGLALGQFVWRAFATNFGVVPVAVVPPLLIAALAAAVLGRGQCAGRRAGAAGHAVPARPAAAGRLIRQWPASSRGSRPRPVRRLGVTGQARRVTDRRPGLDCRALAWHTAETAAGPNRRCGWSCRLQGWPGSRPTDPRGG